MAMDGKWALDFAIESHPLELARIINTIAP